MKKLVAMLMLCAPFASDACVVKRGPDGKMMDIPCEDGPIQGAHDAVVGKIVAEPLKK